MGRASSRGLHRVALCQVYECGRSPERCSRSNGHQCSRCPGTDCTIPITDVAEWMGHKSIEETYRTYLDLMPGSITKAARVLDAGLWEAA